jgi:pyruvate dehydrogenase E2 component (dihydrolipoamide acetyltransferase)
MTEGVISQWLKHEGDTVARGETIAEIETDKATMELEAYDSGVLTRIIAEEGSTVSIGQPIAVIDDKTAAGAEPSGGQKVSTASSDGEPTAAETPAPMAPPAQPSRLETPAPPAPVRATPLVRLLAREHGIDLTTITGSGPAGRIVRADVEDVIAQRSAAAAPSGPTLPSAAPRRAPTVSVGEADEQVPLSSIRRITALRLTESAAAPHFYLTSVADADALQKLRTDLNT